MARTAPSRVYPQPAVFRAGPFTGVTDSPIPPGARPDRLYSAINLYCSMAERRVLGRPGFTLADDQLAAEPIQYIGQFSGTDGTEATILICDGEIYTYDHGTDTVTKVVDAADFAAASVTISTSERIRGVMFFDRLILSDGTNVPFAWDGTAGDAGLTALTNAPVAFGQPVVYYSKLFLIKKEERDTMVWSEEGDAETGYEAGGHNNAWSLPGTKGEPLVALVPRNDSLGIVRPRSTTVVLGAVNDDFQTSGTRSAVSEQIGTSSPDGVLVLDEGTVILDSDGRPQFWPQGSGFAENPAMWEDCLEAIRAIPKTSITGSQMVYDPRTNLILIGTGTVGSSNQAQWLAFERTGGTPNYVGIWNGFTATFHAMVLNDDEEPRWMHGTADGYAYVHGVPSVGPFTDGLQSGDVAIAHSMSGPALGYDTDEECRFDEATFLFYPPTSMTDVSVDYETPKGSSSSPITFDLITSGFMLDEDMLDVDTIGEGGGEQRKRVGWRAFGRWVRMRVNHAVLGEGFGLEGMKVTAFRQGRWPNVA